MRYQIQGDEIFGDVTCMLNRSQIIPPLKNNVCLAVGGLLINPRRTCGAGVTVVVLCVCVCVCVSTLILALQATRRATRARKRKERFS